MAMTLQVRLGLAGPGSMYRLPGGQAAGFIAGLWHGIIAPVTFVVSIFDPDVRMYESTNRGLSYDLGFLIGVSAVFGGSDRTIQHVSSR